MKFYDVEPLSQEWRSIRLGIPTASNFHKILTPKKLALSDQSEKYMYELLAEWMTGEETESYKSEFMQRGNDVEDQIWKAYEAYTGVETSRGGFFTTDDGLIGGSPDRLVGEVGDLEAKAPMIHTQVGYAISGIDDAYMLQLQGRLWLHKRDWVDIFPWHPKLFIPPVRIRPIDKFQTAIGEVIPAFVKTMLEARIKLEDKYGPFTRPEPDEPAEFLTAEDGERIMDSLRV